jgi:hypothetical protein
MDDRPLDLVQPSTDTIGMLRELVAALDRRVPQVERVGEARSPPTRQRSGPRR